MSSSPFLIPDHRQYAEILTDAAVHVLETRGVDRFSVAALARWMKVTPVAINNHYSRARVIELITICFCRRWLHWSFSDARWVRASHPCPALLPRTPEERHGVRVLQALTELAHCEAVQGHPLPQQHLARMREEEREMLESRLTQLAPDRIYRPVPARDMRGLMSLLWGLRQALVEEPRRLLWDEACQLFAEAARAVASSEPDGRTRPPDLLPPNEPAA